MKCKTWIFYVHIDFLKMLVRAGTTVSSLYYMILRKKKSGVIRSCSTCAGTRHSCPLLSIRIKQIYFRPTIFFTNRFVPCEKEKSHSELQRRFWNIMYIIVLVPLLYAVSKESLCRSVHFYVTAFKIPKLFSN